MKQEISHSADQSFGQRKKDHIEISLRQESQAASGQLARWRFQHNAIPEIDLSDVSLKASVFGHSLKSPLFISSMTLGHDGAKNINNRIARVAERRGWMMGVGSQRRQLFDPSARAECEELRKQFPELVLFGNIGLSQVITSSVEQLNELVESLQAQFLVVHTNPLQEAIQFEGTPQFRGGLDALTKLCDELDKPVVLKETGCGFSQKTFESLQNVGLAAIDVSGLGGTHWGRVEGLRHQSQEMTYKVAETFAHWGISTVDSLLNGVKAQMPCDLWASGGVRSGLDAAKLIALGAQQVGFAQPILAAAMQGEDLLEEKLTQLDQELKVALFCLGIENVNALVGKRDLLQWT